MYALAKYDGPARRAVIAYKERGRRELAAHFGRLLAEALARLSGPGVVVVPAPSRAAAARRRGGQHMLEVARRTGVPVRSVLRLDRRARDSVGLDRAGRAANLKGRIRCAPLARGTEVIVVDDVITTGATAAACADVLRKAGANVKAVLALTAT
ncbi:phosphoribosyl transferase-like protein [Actinocrispum wychmicini]|uniref:Phosphoribosyl transferase-like protein n=2 Tax=Actinocrispum wychmicini TaxID=1213861 RepID=A0A4R2K791_9PSEU|nr:phosphoribosyl transferase-like protein [Actinocrispum wychmicini]